MTVRGLVPYIIGAALVLLIAGTYVGFLVPARRELARTVNEAEELIPAVQQQRSEIVGRPFTQSAEQARDAGQHVHADVVADLKLQTVRLRRWFPRLEGRMSDGVPLRDTFKDAYGYNQDELIRELVRIAREQGREIETVPLHRPAFQKEGRLPRDTDEMEKAQLAFNLERLLLTHAAVAGAFPIEAVEVRHDWTSAERDRLFRMTRFRLRLELDPRKLPALLRSVVALGGEGPIVKLESVATSPRPLPARLGPGDGPRIQAELHLVVFTFEPDGQAASGGD